MEYTVAVFAHGAAGPEIDTGCAGVEDGVTANARAMDVPQVFVPVTEIFPFPEPTVTVMLFVVDVPVHPVGSVHV